MLILFQRTNKDARTGKKKKERKKYKTSWETKKKRTKHLEEINGRKYILFVSIFNKTNALCKILNVRTVHRCMKHNCKRFLWFLMLLLALFLQLLTGTLISVMVTLSASLRSNPISRIDNDEVTASALGT